MYLYLVPYMWRTYHPLTFTVYITYGHYLLVNICYHYFKGVYTSPGWAPKVRICVCVCVGGGGGAEGEEESGVGGMAEGEEESGVCVGEWLEGGGEWVVCSLLCIKHLHVGDSYTFNYFKGH